MRGRPRPGTLRRRAGGLRRGDEKLASAKPVSAAGRLLAQSGAAVDISKQGSMIAVERQADPAGRSFSNSLRVFSTREPRCMFRASLAPLRQGGPSWWPRGGVEGHVGKRTEDRPRGGGTSADVFKITRPYPRYKEVRQEVFGSDLPTSTAVAVAGLILPRPSCQKRTVEVTLEERQRRAKGSPAR
jgi:hypothetical protein